MLRKGGRRGQKAVSCDGSAAPRGSSRCPGLSWERKVSTKKKKKKQTVTRKSQPRQPRIQSGAQPFLVPGSPVEPPAGAGAPRCCPASAGAGAGAGRGCAVRVAPGAAPAAGRWPRRGRGLSQPRLAALGHRAGGWGAPLPAGVAITAAPPERHRRQARFTCASGKLALCAEIHRASARATAAFVFSGFSVLTILFYNEVLLYTCSFCERPIVKSILVIAKEKKASLNIQDHYNGKKFFLFPLCFYRSQKKVQTRIDFFFSSLS